jgi:hypothetical protein
MLFIPAHQSVKYQGPKLVLKLTEIGKYLFPGIVFYQLIELIGNHPQKFRIDIGANIPVVPGCSDICQKPFLGARKKALQHQYYPLYFIPTGQYK